MSHDMWRDPRDAKQKILEAGTQKTKWYVMNKRKISKNRMKVMKKVPCTAGTRYSAQTISSYSTRETCGQKLSAFDSQVVTPINTYEC